ncbi:MAG: Na+/H+ antiporter [Anaerolineae bacterium]|nr:Na+/H+ antiporter [Anaerolineae bacterium]
MSQFLTSETIVVALVLVATLVAIVARRRRLPYTVSLVLMGLFIAIGTPWKYQATPDLILAIFVPPLVFEAAFQIDLRELRENLALILTLAVPGVLLTTLLVGGIAAFGAHLPVGPAMVFGAVIAATDPVAVVSLFRALGVPRKLAVTVEGESLFNDGTAIVVFRIALAAVMTDTFDPVMGVYDFLLVSVGGIGVGLVLGWIIAQLLVRLDDRLIESSLTTVLAFGAYLAAEYFDVSGVLAVVVAGLVCGNVGMTHTQPSTKIMIFNLWEYLAFLSNSVVFLLIGLNVELALLWENLGAIAVAVMAVVGSRAIVVYGLSAVTRLLHRGRSISSSWRHVLFWGGLRGAISLALALSLPATLPGREELQAMTFGVVLFTLLAQGTTIQYLLDRLGLTERSPHRVAREARIGRLFAAQAGLRRLEQLYQEGLLPDEMWIGLRDGYRQDQMQVTYEMQELFREHAELEEEMLFQARREALKAERGALWDALRRDLLSDPTYEELSTEIDYRLEALDLIYSTRHEPRPADGEVER